MSLKVYCSACCDFTYHDFRKFPFCGTCRGRGSKWRVRAIIISCVVAFATMVFHLAGWL